MPDRKLHVFPCDSSQDTTDVALRKPIVRELCQRFLAEGRIDPLAGRRETPPRAGLGYGNRESDLREIAVNVFAI